MWSKQDRTDSWEFLVLSSCNMWCWVTMYCTLAGHSRLVTAQCSHVVSMKTFASAMIRKQCRQGKMDKHLGNSFGLAFTFNCQEAMWSKQDRTDSWQFFGLAFITHSHCAGFPLFAFFLQCDHKTSAMHCTLRLCPKQKTSFGSYLVLWDSFC